MSHATLNNYIRHEGEIEFPLSEKLSYTNMPLK